MEETAASPGAPPKAAKAGPEEALRVVMDWAHANRAVLQSPAGQELVPWGGAVQGEPVLLVG